MMSQEQFVAEIQVLRAQLTGQQQQSATLSQALDTVRAEAGNALRELRDTLAGEQQRASALQRRLDDHDGRDASGRARDWGLVKLSEFTGGKFAGARSESWKTWSKQAKIHFNAQKSGFRRALEAIEEKPDTPVDAHTLEDMNWEHAVSASGKLADFLHMYCADDALRIVEGCGESGFEAWRLLVKRHTPTGGRYELDKLNAMLARKQCKDLSDLPAALDILKKDLKLYEATMGKPFPEDFKIPILLQMVPESHKKELQMKYTLGERDFQRMAENISNFATEYRIYEHRGRKDMEVDNVDLPSPPREYTDAEWAEYVDAMWQDYEDISYMGKNGKGKGGKSSKGSKGIKGSKGGKGKDGKDGKGPGTDRPETRTCHWCQRWAI